MTRRTRPGGRQCIVSIEAAAIAQDPRDGKTSCVKRDDGCDYNMKMPMPDSAGRRIGIRIIRVALGTSLVTKSAPRVTWMDYLTA